MRSLKRELNSFYAKVLEKDYSIQQVTKGALSQSRAKLNPSAFTELNVVAARTFYEGAPYRIWIDHRVLAADGSTLVLPDHKTTREEFGVHKFGRNADAERSMATVSIMYDVLNLLTLDAQIDKYAVSEQTLLTQHLSNVAFLKGDLLLLDRGYPSMALMFKLQQMGIEFCIRLKEGWWKEARNMLKDGETDKIVKFTLPPKDRHLQQEFGAASPIITCRLVVIELENGEQEVLCTSLCKRKKYPHDCFKELYHLRWHIEEGYKLFKCRAGLETFSGKTARSVRQDFQAKAFLMTMCAILSYPIEEQVRAENRSCLTAHPRQINRTDALAMCKDIWVGIWIHSKIKEALAALDAVLKKACDIIRPQRSFPRKHRPKKPPAMGYKQL